MFYSHTILSRKGPLGTVWFAAHLQHRLKKSHYNATDIPSTVERIMFPEVPIALRMSGHLLLGVVRIYSKKVDYLLQDCSAAVTGLSKAFASAQLNLPEELRQAPVQSITLPETFDLDAQNLHDAMVYEGIEDSHLRSEEEITLTEQIPVVTDHYVTITFNEDIMMDSAQTEVLQDWGDRSIEMDIPPQSPVVSVAGFQDPGPSDQRQSPTAPHNDGHSPHHVQDPEAVLDSRRYTGPINQTEGFNMGPNNDGSLQDLPEIEILRDTNHDVNLEDPTPVYPDRENNSIERNINFNQVSNEKDHISPVINDLDLGGPSLPFQQHSGPSTSATSLDAPEIQVPVGNNSLNLVLQLSPKMQQPQRRVGKRKFDKVTVLTNRFIKRALDDCSDLKRMRRTAISSSWMPRVNYSLLKEQIFYQPIPIGLHAGQCTDLLDISKKDYICAKLPRVISEEDHADSRIGTNTSPTTQTLEEPRATTPPIVATTQTLEEPRAATPPIVATTQTLEEPRAATPPVVASTDDMEIDRLRSVAATPPAAIPVHHVETEFGNIEGGGSSPVIRDDLTSLSARKLKSVSVSPLRANNATAQTLDFDASTGTHGLDIETPMTLLEDRTFGENVGLSDTHGLINSAEVDELYFLEAESNTPASSQGSEGVNSLSVRTRAVAQFLKGYSPISPIPESVTGDLSLNKILEGKTRKLAARMFYETQVLASYGLVDVQQEEPYGDITLKLTPTLSKAQI